MKTYKPEEYKPSTRDVLLCLSYESQWLSLLKGLNKSYDGILNPLQLVFDNRSFGALNDYSVKGISSVLGIKTSDVAKWSHRIYNDLFELNSNEPELFEAEGTRVDFSINGLNTFAYFTLWLSVPLRQHEGFSWHFLKAKLRTAYFNVESVAHEYDAGIQTIRVHLNTYTPNIYRQFIYDKALFYNLIPESSSISEYALEERLRKIYPH